MMKALAKKREERYQSMGELIAALEGVAAILERTSASTLSLPPLPPGADPKIKPSLPPAPLVSGDVMATTPGKRDGKHGGKPGAPEAGGPPRRAKPATRPLHEPAFASKGPVVALPDMPDEPEPPASRRWPFALLALVLLAGGAGALWLAMRPSDQHEVAAGGDGGLRSGDARPIADEADAGVPDDAVVVVDVPGDGGVRPLRGDAGVGPHPNVHPATVTVEVLTRPGEADVFVGHTFRGPSGVRLQERYGTRLEIECRAPHYKGHTTIVFDGSRDSVMCTARRLPFCVEGLKNPIDDCEQRTP